MRRGLLWLAAIAMACSASDDAAVPVSSSPSATEPPRPSASAAPAEDLPPDPSVAVAKIEPCTELGSRRCAGHGAPAGLTDILYACADTVNEHEWEPSLGADAGAAPDKKRGWLRVGACADGCQEMPLPLPDRCNPVVEIPPDVLAVLSPKPYVEEKCTAEGEARRCKYTSLKIDAEVLVINPDAERVARWVADAVGYIAPLEAIRESEPVLWARAVKAFARQVRMQSSRIFPMKGQIVEDLGGGAVAYEFDRGVVTPCDKGNCRCRINSLTPRAWCNFVEAMGQDGKACRAKFEGADGDGAWRDHCAANHAAAMRSLHNDHFRAKALGVGRAVEKKCGAKGCKPGEVVMRIEKELD